MNSRPPHPFPPVVRWAVFPALAAMAGAAGGGCASLLSGHPQYARDMAGMGGALSAGAALAAAFSVRPWVALLAGPGLGLLVLCGGYAAFERIAGAGPSDPWRLLLELLRSPGIFLIFGGTLWLQAAAHVRELSPARSVSPLTRSLSYLVTAALAFPLGWASPRHENMWPIAAFCSLTTAPQILPLLASLALAKRLKLAIVH